MLFVGNSDAFLVLLDHYVLCDGYNVQHNLQIELEFNNTTYSRKLTKKHVLSDTSCDKSWNYF